MGIHILMFVFAFSIAHITMGVLVDDIISIEIIGYFPSYISENIWEKGKHFIVTFTVVTPVIYYCVYFLSGIPLL